MEPGVNGDVYPRVVGATKHIDMLCDTCDAQIVAAGSIVAEDGVDRRNELPVDGEVPTLEQETEYETINWEEEFEDADFNRKQPFHDE